jgi:hypothetical protein
MSTAKEIVALINMAKINTPHAIDDVGITDDITKVATIDTDEHRWYISATVVFRVGDEYFGVFGPITLKSESMGYADTGIVCEAFEMEAIPSIYYRVKKGQHE